MNILLLDDEGDKLRYISNYIKFLGYDCEQCTDITSLKLAVARKKYDVLKMKKIMKINKTDMR